MKLFLAVALICMLATGSAAAQPTADVVVSIVDQTGAPLPGVRLTIRGATERVADTDTAGDAAFLALPEGDYGFSAELSGFQSQVRVVRVRAGVRVAVSLTLASRASPGNRRHCDQDWRTRCADGPAGDLLHF